MNVSAAPGRRSRAEKNAATTTALLTAAAETFAQRGFEKATMDEIAERVGLSKGALYYRFKTKDDLFMALLDERCQAYIRQLDAAFGPSASAADGWMHMAEAFRAVVEDEQWPKLFFEFVSYAGRSDHAHRELARRVRELRAALATVVERQARDAGIELSIPAERVALGISALCNGLAVERLADPRSVPNAAFFEVPALLMAGAAAWEGQQTHKPARPT